jgi:hypothetical protein
MIYLLTAIALTPGGSSTVQYTFTHTQYTEQHNETEYPERNIHNTKGKVFPLQARCGPEVG